MARLFPILFFLCCITFSFAQAPDADPSQRIPPATLKQMFQRELGPLYREDQADKLAAAHGLIEDYFARPQSNVRKDLVKQIEATGLDAAVLGRIVRIRAYWPVLQPGVFYINERVGPHNPNYFLGIPKGYDRTRSWPLVLKLPGADAFVEDPRPTPQQVQQIYVDWMQEELKKHPDAVVIMPLLNFDELWGPSYIGMNNAIQPVFHAASRVNVDSARVYMIGQGMSGHATWNLAMHYPTYFASICPMAGGIVAQYQKLRIPALRHVYPVIWADADDQIVKPDYSREMVKLLKKLDYRLDYEETKGLGHAPSEELAERLYQKMRARTRDLYPRDVVHASNRPDTLFNRNDWVQVYQELNSGGDQRIRFQHGSGTAILNRNSYSISAALTAPNKIEVRSDNVETMRFYVNDQMIDFAKPVKVVVNTKVRFEGMIKPSVEEMLKDQLFLGRGWRYYTAFIDIDFSTLGATTRPSTRPTTRGKIYYVPPKD